MKLRCFVIIFWRNLCCPTINNIYGKINIMYFLLIELLSSNLIMINCKLVITFICAIIWLVDCTRRRIKTDTTQTFHRTGEAIALDSLIHKYEKEHQKFYKEEIKENNYLKWTAIENKNLSVYCKEYLEYSIPTRTVASAMGVRYIKPLHYMKENSSLIYDIVVVQCKISGKKRPIFYYITRASEPHCVYALKCMGRGIGSIPIIINKYCNFESNLSTINTLKRKRKEISGRMHRETGQPIARDEYLLEYELEHQELLQREGSEGRSITWPYAMGHHNLNNYCYQYLEECVPTRNRKDVLGKWKTEKLHYEELNVIGNIIVTVVICLPYNKHKRAFLMTRAPEKNCVYALLRNGSKSLSIIFKYCDFENVNDQIIMTDDHDILKKNIITKVHINSKAESKEDTNDILPQIEINEEVDNTLATMQLLPND